MFRRRHDSSVLGGTDMARDIEFYEQRIAQERAAAANAVDDIVRERHKQLADLYAERLKAMSAKDQVRQRPTLRVAFDSASQQA